MSDIENTNSTKLIILSVISLAIVGIFAIFSYFYMTNTQQKAPLDRTVQFSDTDVHIETSYNDKYGISRLDITIDEIVEDWQIKAIGEDTTFIKLECETKDKTIKKDYEFWNVKLNKGEKIKGSLIFENSTQKDYVMMKDLLSGDLKIENSEYLSLDTKERDKLQQDYYKKEQNKTNKIKQIPVKPNNNPSFFNNLFDF
jgi:hypothetical protein